MGGPIDKGRKAIKKEQHDASPPVAEFEGPERHLVRQSWTLVTGTDLITEFVAIQNVVAALAYSAIACTWEMFVVE